MAKHETPEIREAVSNTGSSFSERMRRHMESLDDLSAALKEGGASDEIVESWEAKRLLRDISENEPAN